MVCLSWSSLCIFLFFPPLVYCLTFFVSKFQGSMSTSLSVALIWSISCIHGFDWKSWLFINFFFFQISLILEWIELQMQDRSQVKDTWCSFLQVPWSVCQCVCPFAVCLSIHLSLPIHPSIGSKFPIVHLSLVREFWITIPAQFLR